MKRICDVYTRVNAYTAILMQFMHSVTTTLNVLFVLYHCSDAVPCIDLLCFCLDVNYSIHDVVCSLAYIVFSSIASSAYSLPSFEIHCQ